MPTYFPAPELADPDGLVMVGGQLSIPWLLDAYRSGIFPWPILFQQTSVLAWFSPDPRAILENENLYISKRLARRLRSDQFRITNDEAFERVVAGCADPRKHESETWITPAMQRAYQRLNDFGHAHSVEVWKDDQLVGGLYGVAIGGLFAGESMFYRERDASKIALAVLVRHLHRQGFQLFDIQQATDHMVSMGAVEISRREYLSRLRQCRDLDVQFGRLQDMRLDDVVSPPKTMASKSPT